MWDDVKEEARPAVRRARPRPADAHGTADGGRTIGKIVIAT
ncbi:hypothetical protein [Streptomyces longispororuber]|nr:hypothetical protein [Streptomyces longispororuber]